MNPDLNFRVWSVASVMSNSLQPHAPQPTRLLCPQDFPGKNTGWVAVPSSRGSSLLWDQTQVSCIAGGFFTAKAPGKSEHRPISFQILNYATFSSDFSQVCFKILGFFFLIVIAWLDQELGGETIRKGFHFYISQNLKYKLVFLAYFLIFLALTIIINR